MTSTCPSRGRCFEWCSADPRGRSTRRPPGAGRRASPQTVNRVGRREAGDEGCVCGWWDGKWEGGDVCVYLLVQCQHFLGYVRLQLCYQQTVYLGTKLLHAQIFDGLRIATLCNQNDMGFVARQAQGLASLPCIIPPCSEMKYSWSTPHPARLSASPRFPCRNYLESWGPL